VAGVSALLAQSLGLKPDLLLLDEPDQPLGYCAIAWLEETLLGFPALWCLLPTTGHFAEFGDRILELDHDSDRLERRLHGFLVHKEAALAAEDTINALFDKKLAEEIWIRRVLRPVTVTRPRTCPEALPASAVSVVNSQVKPNIQPDTSESDEEWW
jgi:ATP-binding cassette subfamily F protein uup